jgi:hypothetical protein
MSASSRIASKEGHRLACFWHIARALRVVFGAAAAAIGDLVLLAVIVYVADEDPTIHASMKRLIIVEECCIEGIAC